MLSKRIAQYLRSNVLGLAAIFIALGGTAIALPGHNKVRSDDIKNGAVKSADAGDDALTGTDILESSLGTVPNAVNAANATNATNATNAGAVGGVSEQAVRFSQPTSTGLTLLTTINNMKVRMGCDGGGNATVQFQGTSAGEAGTASVINDNDTAELAQFSNSGAASFSPVIAVLQGAAMMRRVGGSIVRLDFEVEQISNGFGTTDRCFLNGFARTAP